MPRCRRAPARGRKCGARVPPTPLIPAKAGIQLDLSIWHISARSPEFTNEVQHLLVGVLPWDGGTNSFPWKTDVRLPAFRPMAVRSGKSRQLFIARRRRSLE